MPLRTSSTCLKAPNDPHGLQLAGRPAQQLSVVCIGSGTGLASLLKGLKTYVRAAGSSVPASEPAIAELSAIVTVTDDGGSSGMLRKEFNVLPPGDIRNCITALAADDGLLQQVFQHRFRAGVSLNGHRFGNLFLTALTAVTGDFCEAVAQSSRILATCGHIYPIYQVRRAVRGIDGGRHVRAGGNPH
jgi:uncharacterized cofD-like protein